MGEEWYKLDNVAFFYAALRKKKRATVFRYTVSMKDDIDEAILLRALKETINLFPNFHLCLKQGFFWHYLEESSNDVKVSMENRPIAGKIIYDEEDILYRLTYYKRRINLDTSHVLADGRGAMTVFQTLISFYVKYKYDKSVKVDINSSKIDRIEDSFDKYFKKSKLPHESHKKIYRYKGRTLGNKTRFMEIHMPLDKILKLSHDNNISLTGYLVSVLIYSIIKEMKTSELDKLIKVEIPVDLRSFYGSNSNKNFFGLATVDFRPSKGNTNFEDIINVVRNEFKDRIKIEKLEERVNQMVNFQKLIAARMVPLFIKDIFMLVMDYFAKKMHTTNISNLGSLKFDEKVDKYVEYATCFASTEGFQFTVISNKKDLCIGISSIYKYNNIIRNFSKFFKDKEIDENIYTEVC